MGIQKTSTKKMANINDTINFDGNSGSVLTTAVYYNKPYDIIKLLIDHGANVDNLDLSIAIHKQVPDTVSMLLVDNIETLAITKWIEMYCKAKKEFVLSTELYEHILKREQFYTGFDFNTSSNQTMLFFETMYNYPSITVMQKFREKGLDIANCTDDEGFGLIDLISLHFTNKDIEDSVFINLIDYLINELEVDINKMGTRGRMIDKVLYDAHNVESPAFLRINVLKHLLDNGSTIIPSGSTTEDGIIPRLLDHADNNTEIMEMLKKYGVDYSDPFYLMHAIEESEAPEDIVKYLERHT